MAKRNQSALEAEFVVWLRQEGIGGYQLEHQFHPERKWAFDVAWPDKKVAVELEGLTYRGGRHQRMEGFTEDCLKYEAALVMGWTVYRVPGSWIYQGKTRIWRVEVMEVIRMLLEKA